MFGPIRIPVPFGRWPVQSPIRIRIDLPWPATLTLRSDMSAEMPIVIARPRASR